MVQAPFQLLSAYPQEAIAFTTAIEPAVVPRLPAVMKLKPSEEVSLGTARTYHTATLLANGKVLVVGGVRVTEPCCTVSEGAELDRHARAEVHARVAVAEPQRSLEHRERRDRAVEAVGELARTDGEVIGDLLAPRRKGAPRGPRARLGSRLAASSAGARGRRA